MFKNGITYNVYLMKRNKELNNCKNTRIISTSNPKFKTPAFEKCYQKKSKYNLTRNLASQLKKHRT